VNQFFAGVTQVPDYGSGALLRGAVRVLFQIFSLGDEQQRTSEGHGLPALAFLTSLPPASRTATGI
jgi:hypothetical protein